MESAVKRDILRVAARLNRPCPSDIHAAEDWNVARRSVHRSVRQLCDQGYLQRCQSEDSRSFSVEVTEVGQEELDKLAVSYATVCSDIKISDETLTSHANDLAAYDAIKAQRKIEAKSDLDLTEIPDEWSAEKWKEVLKDAREQANLPVDRGNITVKTINGRKYYFLIWAESGEVHSEYIAPKIPDHFDTYPTSQNIHA